MINWVKCLTKYIDNKFRRKNCEDYMKIGKFAEKYGVTLDAVRYYLERGLLVAQKRGEQYFFTDADGKDLEK